MAITKWIVPQKTEDGRPLKIRNPQNQFRHIAEGGENVVWSTHWARAESRGDIKVFDENPGIEEERKAEEAHAKAADDKAKAEEDKAKAEIKEQAANAPQSPADGDKAAGDEEEAADNRRPM